MELNSVAFEALHYISVAESLNHLISVSNFEVSFVVWDAREKTGI